MKVERRTDNGDEGNRCAVHRLTLGQCERLIQASERWDAWHCCPVVGFGGPVSDSATVAAWRAGA